MSGAGSPPPLAGAPEVLLIEGILDGRVLQEQPLRDAVDRLSGCGAGSFRIEVTGGRFNVMPADSNVPPQQFDEAAQSNFLDGLQAVIDAAKPGSVETNLRCKLIYRDDVAETMFHVQGNQVEPVSRRRPRTAQDASALPTATAEAPLGLKRRELLWLAPVLLVVGVAFAWKTGWFDRVLAARAEQLTVETGPFGAMIAVELERSWGNYYLKLKRGVDYPTTPDELAARKDASPDLSTRAATELVGNGGELFVQLVNDEGKVLAEARTELRPLLADVVGEVDVKLPGRMAAHHVALSLSASKKSK